MKTKWGEKGESRTCTATTGKQRRARGVHERKRVGTWKGFGFFSETCIHFIFCSTTSKLTRPPSRSEKRTGGAPLPCLELWLVCLLGSTRTWSAPRRVPEARLDAYRSAPRRVPKRAPMHTEARPDAHWSAPANSFADAQIVGQNRNLISILHYEW